MPYSTSLFARFLRALHRSRRRQARREISRHQHLIAEARAVASRPAIDPQPSGEPQPWTSTRTEAGALFGALREWRRIFQADRYTQQPRS